MRQANNKCYEAGRPHIIHPTIPLIKKSKQIFRSTHRTEIALGNDHLKIFRFPMLLKKYSDFGGGKKN
jgi:hypothetical protein